MSKVEKYAPSQTEQDFLSLVTNGKYDREIITGLKKFVEGTVPQDMQGFYSKDELDAIIALDGTEKDLQSRMPVKSRGITLSRREPPKQFKHWLKPARKKPMIWMAQKIQASRCPTARSKV